ncbi:MAG: hypothetical protein WC440_03755 [Candidatus Omnitrophota bacterium]|jgi:hypothetical protein
MKISKKESQRILKLIETEKEKGNIVFNTIGGLMTVRLDDFIKQPVDGILYDLNRQELTSEAFLTDSKWINDYAVALVIRKLYDIVRSKAR